MKHVTTIPDFFKLDISIPSVSEKKRAVHREEIGRIDTNSQLRKELLRFCRLKRGEIWEDSIRGHQVGVLDATNIEEVKKIMSGSRVDLIINDPPYNINLNNRKSHNLGKINIAEYIGFSKAWLVNALKFLAENAHFYVWIGLDIKENLQPLPDFIMLVRKYPELKPRNIITLRNQRGYGTQHNWMWVRQELLYYIKGSPKFNITAEYTDIPKILRGYYKEVNGKITENLERGHSNCIRAGNVWVDIQQVFYRLEENVPGCYAQKPLKAIERIILSGSKEGDLVADFFAHSGTTLLAGEIHKRKVVTFDIDPIYAELTIRRLERFRNTGLTGWQWRNPFPEMSQFTEMHGNGH